MEDTSRTDETHSLRGPIDRAALLTIRDVIDREEPLATPELDSYLNPTCVEVRLDDGLRDASAGRIDIQWTTEADYKYHYTDTEDVNFRWGAHPHDGDYIHVSGLEHYHPPPNASSTPAEVEESCIELSLEALVTRAVVNYPTLLRSPGWVRSLVVGLVRELGLEPLWVGGKSATRCHSSRL